MLDGTLLRELEGRVVPKVREQHLEIAHRVCHTNTAQENSKLILRHERLIPPATTPVLDHDLIDVYTRVRVRAALLHFDEHLWLGPEKSNQPLGDTLFIVGQKLERHHCA